MRKTKGLKKLLTGIMAIVMLFFALTVSVYAATSVSYDGSGVLNLTGTGKEQVEASLQEQVDVLTSCGLNATLASESVELSTDSATFSSMNASNIKKYHDNLIKNGILSFIVYDNSVCSLKVDGASATSLNLVVCLDFSNYNITVFEEDFLEGIVYALMGSVSLGSLGNSSMTNDTEETYAHNTTGEAIHPVKYIDAALGAEIDKTVKLYFRGMSARDNFTTYMTIDGGKSIYVHAYSLHIVLPRNSWGDTKATIRFASNSLTIDGFWNWSISVDPPECIGLDISGIALDSTGENDYVQLDDHAAPDTKHFHYVGTQHQMEYCMKKSFDRVLSPSHTTTDYVEEIFIKPFTDSHFTRGYAGIGKENGKLYASVYDQIPDSGSTMAATRTGGILILYYWLRYAYVLPEGYAADFTDKSYITYRHYRRNENTYLIESAVGALTADFTFDATDEAGRWISVYCTHAADGGVGKTPNLVGSFRRVANGVDENGTTLYASEFLDSDGVALAAD